MKKLLTCFLAAVILLTLLPLGALSVSAASRYIFLNQDGSWCEGTNLVKRGTIISYGDTIRFQSTENDPKFELTYLGSKIQTGSDKFFTVVFSEKAAGAYLLKYTYTTTQSYNGIYYAGETRTVYINVYNMEHSSGGSDDLPDSDEINNNLPDDDELKDDYIDYDSPDPPESDAIIVDDRDDDKHTHVYSYSCDDTCNTCWAIRTIKHSYKTVTKKATTTANGYTVKRCSVCKKEIDKTTIYKASKISLSKTVYTYNGKVQKPSVTVKDSKGKTISSKYYTVTYASGRKNVGTYKVTVKFKGNYSGTKTLTFKINPPKTTVKSLTAGSKKLTASITKKSSQVTGYQIQYSTSKSFKTYKSKTVSSYKTTKATLTGLKAKKTYYVRVRTYKTVGGKKYYSGWSTIKYKKTK